MNVLFSNFHEVAAKLSYSSVDFHIRTVRVLDPSLHVSSV